MNSSIRTQVNTAQHYQQSWRNQLSHQAAQGSWKANTSSGQGNADGTDLVREEVRARQPCCKRDYHLVSSCKIQITLSFTRPPSRRSITRSHKVFCDLPGTSRIESGSLVACGSRWSNQYLSFLCPRLLQCVQRTTCPFPLDSRDLAADAVDCCRRQQQQQRGSLSCSSICLMIISKSGSISR